MVQSLALGGITDGVCTLEMAAAFGSIANKGTYNEPVLYTQVLDHDGNVLIDNSAPATHQAVKESTAYLLTSAMETVVDEGTGRSAKLSNMATAGKTGSTNDYVDIWFCGFTPYYTATIWGGYDENKDMNGMSTWQLKIWHDIMERVHEGLENKQFEVPSSVVERTICSKTGLLAVSGCPAVTNTSTRKPLQKNTVRAMRRFRRQHRKQLIRVPAAKTTDPNAGGNTTDPGTVVERLIPAPAAKRLIRAAAVAAAPAAKRLIRAAAVETPAAKRLIRAAAVAANSRRPE